MDHYCQIPRSPAAVSHHANRRREDVTLPLSTLAEWVGRVGVALQPLVDRLILHLLQSRVLHADETPVAQLDPGSGKRNVPTWGVSQQRF
ncbi:MAG: transposase [Nitrosomonas sp.]|nr:transposase [Nitrosomonas sp.]